jgi:glycosyltransferase involved in cell wall biosynthesis
MSTIVHLFGAMNRGGAETRMLELLSNRDSSDERHVFIALSGDGGELDADLERLGHQVVPRRLDLLFPLWFVRFLRQSAATHIHSHVHLASGYLLFLGWVARVPRRIAHVHSTADGRSSGALRRIYRRVGRSLIRVFATDVVAVSGAALRTVIGSAPWTRRRCSVLHDQVDGSRFDTRRGVDDETLRVGIVGRMDSEKNPARCLEIVDELRRRHLDDRLRVWFAGSASAGELGRLQRRADEFGLAAIVEFLGVRDDIPALLARTDLLLSTTRREGLPGAVIEAAAAGVPSVVSAIAPNDEAARFLAGVVTVPLQASNAEWCDVIEDVLDRRSGRLAAPAIRASFERSPFALASRNVQVDNLWS